MDKDAIQQQLDEFACVLSMFPGADELVYDHRIRDQYEQFLSAPHMHVAAPSTRFEYAIRFTNHEIHGFVPELEIAYPRGYPITAQIQFVVRCPTLARARMEELQTDLAAIAGGNDGEMVALQLYQCMFDRLEPAITEDSLRERDTKKGADVLSSLDVSVLDTHSPPQVLGRRAIYFHHIIASTKRRVVKEWALELKLGGFSKIGWPGVVIIEGDELDAQEYVRRLQHLRWKQMVVRGEQTEAVQVGQSIESMRRLPSGFCEFPETAMSEAATLCRQAGLEELFLSVMKIYRTESSSSERHPNVEEDNSGRGALTNKTKQPRGR